MGLAIGKVRNASTWTRPNMTANWTDGGNSAAACERS
jgi:hypothetical protein